MRLLLVHGGLYEGMTGARFWKVPGVVESLEGLGHEVVTAERLRRPANWLEEGSHLARHLGGAGEVDPVVAGSNGCSAALRLVLDHLPGMAVVLCWPATRSAAADAVTRQVFAAANVGAVVQDALLAGDTLRGVSDHELRHLSGPVSIVPSEPENPLHARVTAERLAALIPTATIRAGFPEPPNPLFAQHRASFVNELDVALVRQEARQRPSRRPHCARPGQGSHVTYWRIADDARDGQNTHEEPTRPAPFGAC